MGDGLVGKTWALCLTHLDSSPAASSPSLMGIHKGWPTGLNLSALPEGWRSLANPHFFLPKKTIRRVVTFHEGMGLCL